MSFYGGDHTLPTCPAGSVRLLSIEHLPCHIFSLQGQAETSFSVLPWYSASAFYSLSYDILAISIVINIFLGSVSCSFIESHDTSIKKGYSSQNWITLHALSHFPRRAITSGATGKNTWSLYLFLFLLLCISVAI